MDRLEVLKERLKELKANRGTCRNQSYSWQVLTKEIEKVKVEIKEIERPDKLEELKKQLEYFQRTKDIFEKRAKVKGEKIEKVKAEINQIEETKSDHSLDALNYYMSAYGFIFVPPCAFATLPEKNYHIVTSKDDPKPHKIKINDRTEKTIQFFDCSDGKTYDRMFISDFLNNYTIHESFD